MLGAAGKELPGMGGLCFFPQNWGVFAGMFIPALSNLPFILTELHLPMDNSSMIPSLL